MQRPADAVSPAAGVLAVRAVLPGSVDRDRRTDRWSFRRARGGRVLTAAPPSIQRETAMFTRFAASAALCLLALRAAADSLLAQIPVGVYPSYPPLDMRDLATGALSGFDVELGQQLVKRLNTRFDMQETAFAQLVASVQT